MIRFGNTNTNFGNMDRYEPFIPIIRHFNTITYFIVRISIFLANEINKSTLKSHSAPKSHEGDFLICLNLNAFPFRD